MKNDKLRWQAETRNLSLVISHLSLVAAVTERQTL